MVLSKESRGWTFCGSIAHMGRLRPEEELEVFAAPPQRLDGAQATRHRVSAPGRHVLLFH